MSSPASRAAGLFVAVSLSSAFGCALVGAVPCGEDSECRVDELCVQGFCERIELETDAGPQPSEDDAGVDTDAGVDAGMDAGVDAGVDAVDGGASDAGVSDAGVSDAGVSDAGDSDAGALDAGGSDAGLLDAGQGPAWFNTQWRHRAPVDLSNFAPDAVDVRVPVAVELNQMHVDRLGAINGADVRFVNAQGQVLPSAPESPSDHWVAVAHDDLDDDGHIYVYFGNALVSGLPPNPFAVDYEGVWHLNGDVDDEITGAFDPSESVVYTDGLHGLAVDVDGSHATIAADHPGTSDAAALTLCVAFFPRAITGEIVSFSNDVLNRETRVGVHSVSNTSGVMSGIVRVADEAATEAATSFAPTLQEWSWGCVDVNYEQNIVRYIHNGTIESALPNAFAADRTLGASLLAAVGAEEDDSDRFFNGLIDEVRLAKKRFSAAEHRALYSGTKGFEAGAIESL